MQRAVLVKNLTKRYGDLMAIKGVDFDVAENEIFSLIGPNGAGKSTCLRILATVLASTSGEAKIFGLDVEKEADEVRKIISYLPEEAGAYKNLSGLAYLKFMAAIFTDDSKRQKECVEFASEIAGLGSRLKDKIKNYSKGMTRKILLARAVMTRPKLAILDEPTSGLDVINAMEIRNMIRGLSRQGMSVLLSSHNMLEIEFLSDRVGIIHQGEMREIGAPSDLRQKHGANNLEEVFMSIARG